MRTGGNQPLLVPLCVRIVPDYMHGQIATVTKANQEDMSPSGWAPLTMPSGGRDGLRPGLANYLDPVAWKGIDLPWAPSANEDSGASVLYRACTER